MPNWPKIILPALGVAALTAALAAFIFLSTVTADCAWGGSAKAWVDVNKNGYLDQGETLLHDIVVHVDDVQNNYVDIASPAITNKEGETKFAVFMGGCPNVSFEVYADAPPGYRFTTQPRVKVKEDIWGTLDTETIYYFGFFPLE